MLYCSVNGQKSTSLSVTDRAFAYGDGLFTTAKIENGKVSLLTQHINRLKNGVQRLNLINIDFTAISDELKQLAQAYNIAVVKVIISAGSGGRGYSRQGADQPTVVISVFDFPSHYITWQKQGVTLGLSEQRLGVNPMMAGMKHLNRLEQVLLRAELDQTHVDDLVVRNIDDDIIETTCANLFCLIDNVLYTPLIEHSGVAGLMRNVTLALFPQTIIKKIGLSELLSAQEIFICNSVMGIVPVNSLNSQVLAINKIKHIQYAVSASIHTKDDK